MTRASAGTYRRGVLIKAALLAIVVLFWGALSALGIGAAWQAIRGVASDVRTWRQWRSSRAWPQTSGTVTRSWVRVERGHRYKTFTPEVAYTYTVGGRRCVGTRHGFTTSLASWSHERAAAIVAKWPRAANVTVWFDPANAEVATLDRGRPPLWWPLAVVGMLLLMAALFTAGGVYGLTAIEPLPFADHELPPLRQQVGCLLLIVGGLGLVVATFVLRRTRRNDGLVARLEAASPVRAADAKPGQEVVVFGTAEAGGEGDGRDATAVASPVAGLPAFRGRLVVHFDDRSERETTIARGFWVRDAGGRWFVPGQARVEFVDRCAAVEPERIQDWLGSVVTADVVPAIDRIDAWLIAPGDPVLVVGRLARHAKSREPELAVPTGSGDAVLAAHTPLAALLARLRATRWRTLRSAAVVLSFAGLVLSFA